MSENPAASDDLQFDRAITESPSGSTVRPAVVCQACQAVIETQYFDINGKSFCGRCRETIESAAETPRGMVPFVTASLYGLGAGIVGALLYYAVSAIAHLEIGLVAVVIGYMVGYAVRTGARGRGGLRFQVVAVALTYGSVALAYTPLVFGTAAGARPGAETVRSSTDGTNVNVAPTGSRPQPTAPRPRVASLFVGMGLLLAFIAALPVLMVAGTLPSGLISAFIIFIGMRQAWRMTGAPSVQIFGPYAVGTAPAPGGV